MPISLSLSLSANVHLYKELYKWIISKIEFIGRWFMNNCNFQCQLTKYAHFHVAKENCHKNTKRISFITNQLQIYQALNAWLLKKWKKIY